MRLLVLACLSAGLAACTTVGPDYQRPPVAVEAKWSSVSGATSPPAAEIDAQWWRLFQDPALDALIAAALANNPTLQSAAVRVAQAQAQLQITEGGALPQVEATVGNTYSKPDLPSQLQGKHQGSNVLQVAAPASWEIDFWGAVRRGVESDRASLQSDEAAYQAARVSLVASVASTYLGARTLEQRIAVAQANLAEQAESLRIANVRFQAGEGSELDVRQAQAQYGLTESQLPSLQTSLQQAWHAINVLVGLPPEGSGAPGDTVQPGHVVVPQGIPLGMPRDLLRRRPDVVQAEYAVAAQSARIGQSQAALYPSFTLNGSIGFQATDAGNGHLGDIFSWSSRTLALGGGFTLPIFDRGRLVAQVQVQDALFQQAVLAYQEQVLKAQQEVEDALATIRGNLQARSSLSQAREGARRSAVLALQRYEAGETDYTTVVAAEQSRLQLEDNFAIAEGNLLQGYVSAYRALGGGWGGDLTPPPRPPSAATLSSPSSSIVAQP
jgi:NodT family efflux transporter outer membrane factor (OMF) lipoprotein